MTRPPWRRSPRPSARTSSPSRRRLPRCPARVHRRPAPQRHDAGRPHPQLPLGVTSRGETSDFAKALLAEVGDAGGKAELIKRSAHADFRAVGARYCARLATEGGARSVDKTPINFLYLGLIARALPQARIIHVRRNPMDLGYAIYKTLFRMAYPFSYDLKDLGHYYLAYERLMAHWRAMLPGGFLEVDYEDLVATPGALDPAPARVLRTGVAGRMPGLRAQRAPLPDGQRRAGAQPIYSSSVGLWRRYREQLQPLADVLRAGGLEPDPGLKDAAP